VVVGIVDPAGTQVFGFGRRRLGGAVPDGQTIFEIGEVTRTFTTLLLARMVERGELTLEKPVRELLPDSVSVPSRMDQPITLEQLASDRSGLPSRPGNLAASPLDWSPPFANPWGGYTQKRLDEFLSSYDLDRAPGAKIVRSNLGMGLLADALVRAARAGYDTLATRELFDRLGMSDTRVALGHPGDRRSQGYVVGFGGARGWRLASPAHPWSYGALTGAGGLHSTANDLLAFLQAHLHLRSSDLAWAMDETRRPRYRGRGNEAVGLGWSARLGAPGAFPVVWSAGATGGTRSWVGMDEARRVGVVILSNSTMPIDELGFDILRAAH
jgi:CubicO group peptidase (beta-lactamase class C family)